MTTRMIHRTACVIGSSFLVLAIVQALVFRYPHFYTSFALGSWLVLDYIDWRLTGFSILGYFWQHRHRDAFFVFFVMTTALCFIVDFVYGVKLLRIWEWVGYRPIHFLRMYLIMNASYVLGMYELWRVVRTILARRLSAEHVFKFTLHDRFRVPLFIFLIVSGSLFLAAPLYTIIFHTNAYGEYVMLLPFIGMVLTADGTTGLLHGKPVLEEFVRGNRLEIASASAAVLAAALVTEALNLAGGEWRYIKMPLPDVTIFGIPAAVFGGWIPLVLGALAVVNAVRRANEVWDARNRSNR